MLGVLAMLSAAWYAAGVLVEPTPKVIGPAPDELHAVSFTVGSESGTTIHGWHTQGNPGAGVIVLLHGIRGNRRTMLERIHWLNHQGYSTVSIDFQAHGESPGERIALGYLEKLDARAAVAYARQEHPGESIGVIGVSLGGAAALLASPLDIDALVLESVYTDINTAIANRMEVRLGPLSPLATALLLVQLKPRLGISPDELRPIGHIAQAGCPVYVISGSADLHTTAPETEELFARAVEPKEIWLVEGAAHVNLMGFAPDDYRKHVGDFLRRQFETATEGGDR